MRSGVEFSTCDCYVGIEKVLDFGTVWIFEFPD
jgi:hypothetical protein